jgi:hypothetical protein
MSSLTVFIILLIIWCVVNPWDLGGQDEEALALIGLKDGKDASGGEHRRTTASG